MGRWFFLAVLIVFSLPLFGQRKENLRAAFANGKVTILYNVTGGKERQTYSIQVFGSHNNYSSPLRLVTGDVGDGVKGGNDRKVVWDAEAELVTFSGGITFRIQGELVPLKLNVIRPAVGGTLRRGKGVLILWEGGLPDQNVRIELFRGNERVTLAGDSKNTGSYSWNVPKDLAKGPYTLHMNCGQEKTISEIFTVKAKIPMGLKVAAGVLVAWAIVLLIPDKAVVDPKLPLAPDPL